MMDFNGTKDALALALVAALALAAHGVAAEIKEQRREGAMLIVTRTDGTVETNSLFLALAPEAKAQMERRQATEAMAAALRAITADTRANIPATAGMGDAEIAALYLRQMTKDAATLLHAAPTNTVEYIIGTGMRQDLEAAGTGGAR